MQTPKISASRKRDVILTIYILLMGGIILVLNQFVGLGQEPAYFVITTFISAFISFFTMRIGVAVAELVTR